MDDLIQQAEDLRNNIKEYSFEIDNPSLTISILSQLDFFIENIEGSE